MPEQDSNTSQETANEQQGFLSIEEAVEAQLEEPQDLDTSETESVEELDTTPQQDLGSESAEHFDALEDEPPDYLFEVAGQGIDLEEARKGYMRQDDYTRKRQKDAERERELEAIQAEMLRERALYRQGLERFKKYQDTLDTEPDWSDLRERDPEGYLIARADWDDSRRRIKSIEDEEQRLAELSQAELNRSLTTHIQREREKLLEAMPEWRDQKIASQAQADMREYLQTVRGFTEQEIANVTDSRLLMVIADALKGSSLDGKAPIAKKKVAKARKGISRGQRTAQPTREDKRIRQANERLDQTGSLEDGIALQLAAMGLPPEQ